MRKYDMYGRRKYDFAKFLERFTKMTEFQIKIEYAIILNALARLEKKTEGEYFEYSEPLIQAQTYIEGYLAKKVLFRSGFYVREDGQICYECKGRDLLHNQRVCLSHPREASDRA